MIPELHLIIIAAGNGQRFGRSLPKQFSVLGGEPLLFHTFRAFSDVKDIQYTLVLNNDYVEFWKELCNKYGFSVPHNIVVGGETRFHSVKNGLQHISDDSIVIIHDGARPFPSSSTIRNVIEKAVAEGNAVPAIDVWEAVRIFSGKENKHIDRSRVKIIQTPQAFDAKRLKQAYCIEFDNSFVDDAIVFEKAGNPINIVEGNPENIKITYEQDMAMAEIIRNGMKREDNL